MANANLNTAKSVKDDEFYTCYEDIEKEIKHYTKHFENKVVFCNCDDPEWSNFWKYFYDNFDNLKLKKLISTHYEKDKQSYKLEYNGSETVKTALQGDGDFRSDECIAILKSADIVATNPPFSLFRQYIAQLIEYEKTFLIIGSWNAITCKDVFPLMKNNQMWLGYNSVKKFIKPNGEYKTFGNITWYSNLDIDKRHKPLKLSMNYKGNEHLYPKYDNYNAIEIGKVKNIPKDYDGVMGVPITFLDKFNYKQFEIIGLDRYVSDNPNFGKRFTINQKETYARILIKKRKDVTFVE